MQGAETAANGTTPEPIYIPEDGVTNLVNAMAEGFRTHPLEIALFILLLAGFVVALIVMGRIIRRREREALVAKSEQSFAALVTKHKLSDEERRLAERMADSLDDDGRRHLVLTDPHIFNAVLRKMYGRERVPAAVANSLRQKLGFDKTRPAAPKSTAELPPGAPVRLLRGNETFGTGSVAGIEDEALIVTLDGAGAGEAGRIKPGTPLRLLTAGRQGIHVFETAVLSSQTATLKLRHAPRAKAYQRRKYFRSPVKIPVFIRQEQDAGDLQRTLIRDLSGGGARLDDPGIRPSAGDRLELYFRNDPEKARPLRAEVVRRSKSGNDETISVRFGAISESERDKIISFINKGTGNRASATKN